MTGPLCTDQCVLPGCGHPRTGESRFCLFHETPADRERASQSTDERNVDYWRAGCECNRAGLCYRCQAAAEIERLRKLLTDCADPVSGQLAEARRNLELYKGYSSRERRYQIEIEGLERLLKEIGNG